MKLTLIATFTISRWPIDLIPTFLGFTGQQLILHLENELRRLSIRHGENLMKTSTVSRYRWFSVLTTSSILSFALSVDSDVYDIAKNKTKPVAWFVSHCKTRSARELLTKKLQKFIDVDVYGECGTLQCEKSSECYEMLSRDYKFYLAFENSLCDDYITEKVFNPMMHNILPVVYSGADISRFLPPKSFINAESFETAEDLAQYLNFLMQNPKEYIKYFWWKKHYKVIHQNTMDICNLCRKLNEPRITYMTQSYDSIRNWYSKNSCREPRIKF